MPPCKRSTGRSRIAMTGLRATVLAASLVAVACSAVTDSELAGEVPGETATSSEVATDTSEDPAPTVTAVTEPPGDTAPAVWTKLTEPGVGGRITSLAFDPGDPNRLLVGGDMLGIAITDDFGETWQSTTGLASWEIGDIAPAADAEGRIWTGSLSGPQASADGGRSWELARDGMPPISESAYSLPIEAVLVDPSDRSRLLAFSGNQRNWSAPGAYSGGTWQGDGSVWESSDAGRSWTRLATVAAGANIRAATFLGGDSALLLAAAANRGVFASADGGATWTDASNGLPHSNSYDIAGHPSDPTIAWVAMGEGPAVGGSHVAGGIWMTTDGGRSWTAANDGMDIISNATPGNTGSFHQIVVAASDPGRLYTSNVAPGQAAVYRSDDSGSTWTVVADADTERPDPYEGALRAFDIAVHPSDPDRVAIGSDDTLLGSVDGGATWSDLTTERTAEGLFIGRGYSGLVSTDIVFDARRPDDVVLLGFDGGNFVQSVDGGVSWRRTIQDVSPWGGAVEAVYSPTDPDRIYVLLGQFSNFRGIGISTDGGAEFSLAVGAEAGLPAAGNVDAGAQGIAALDNNSGDIVFAVIGRRLWRSRDSGDAFQPVDELSDVRDVAVTGDGAVFVATAGGVFESTDSGETFAGISGSPAGVTHLFTSVAEPDHVYAAAFRDGEGGAYRFDGSAFQRIFEDRYAHSIAIDPVDPSNIAIVTTEPAFHDISNATGVHLSADSGATWSVMNDGLPMTRLRTAEFDPSDPDRLVVGTTGRGFYEVSFSAALDR